MSVIFYSKKPQLLLDSFDEKIEQKEPKGKINTWRKTPKGFYTHTAERWKDKAFFKPRVEDDKIVFNICPLAGENQVVTSEDYSFYHGHLTETFLNHFDENFTSARSSAKPTENDNVG